MAAEARASLDSICARRRVFRRSGWAKACVAQSNKRKDKETRRVVAIATSAGGVPQTIVAGLSENLPNDWSKARPPEG